MPFTDKQIRALRPRGTRYEIPEPGRTGLAIRVTPYGAKTWTFRYRYEHRQRRLVLGEYPSMSLADAREALAKAKKQLALGQDPAIELSPSEPRVATVEFVANAYLDYIGALYRPTTVREDHRILSREVTPIWGTRPITGITRRDVMTLLGTIEQRGAYVMRNRVAGLLSRFFRFAVEQGWIELSPAFQIRRLRKLAHGEVERARTRVLTTEEIRSFWHGLNKIPIIPSLRAALRWALLTGQRRTEVAFATRDEIDDTAGLWRIPSQRTKNRKAHIVPLPNIAIALLTDIDQARLRKPPGRLNRTDRHPYDPTPSQWLFPSRRYHRPINPNALTQAINRYRAILGIGDATVHDLRRTFATYHVEIGTPKEIVSALLNHAPQTITDQVYNHASQLAAKQQAMDRWSAWLTQLLA